MTIMRRILAKSQAERRQVKKLIKRTVEEDQAISENLVSASKSTLGGPFVGSSVFRKVRADAFLPTGLFSGKTLPGFDLLRKTKVTFSQVKPYSSYKLNDNGTPVLVDSNAFMDLSRGISRSDTKQTTFQHRDQLKLAKRIVVKLGSAVITRADGCGLALGRLASIVEQCAELQNEGREMMMVTSGAVAFGKQKMAQELLMSLSMRETLSNKDNFRGEDVRNLIANRASAAVGQSGLMSLYEAMFAQYGVKVAQILMTKPDFYNDETRQNLASTLNELLSLNILPIINTNDAVSPPPNFDEEISRKLDIRDNDSLAARLATEVNTDLLILMTDVDGIFNKPPKMDGAKLIDIFNPEMFNEVEFGKKSSVGTGGMDSKVKAASWSLERGTNVVICNGMAHAAIKHIIDGRKIGTFFSSFRDTNPGVEVMARNARSGCRILQSLSTSKRSAAIEKLADLLVEREDKIMEANQRDLREAHGTGTSQVLISRLALTPAKLTSLATGLRQIAASSLEKPPVGRVVRRTKLANGVDLKQITVPIGVLLVIFESRPDCLPQIAALSLATGNGLMLKGGKEAMFTNNLLMELVKEALGTIGCPGAMSLVASREEITDLLQMEGEIDLVIPRGSSELVKSIQDNSKAIPVLGHSEGICHVYVDKAADLEKAVRIVRDSKCDYPSACNAMETLLVHEEVFNSSNFFHTVCQALKQEGVEIYAGKRLSKSLTFGPSVAQSFKTEYGDLACTIEIVSNMEEAISHIDRFGSSHTDVIVTENEATALEFQQAIDSACVFHNASSRFADGYRFGLGAEVGISTGRIHARGPVGMEGLLTTKWLLSADDDAIASDFALGYKKFLHQSLPLDNEQCESGIEIDFDEDSSKN